MAAYTCGIEFENNTNYGQDFYRHVFDEMPLTQPHQIPQNHEVPPYSPYSYVPSFGFPPPAQPYTAPQLTPSYAFPPQSLPHNHHIFSHHIFAPPFPPLHPTVAHPQLTPLYPSSITLPPPHEPTYETPQYICPPPENFPQYMPFTTTKPPQLYPVQPYYAEKQTTAPPLYTSSPPQPAISSHPFLHNQFDHQINPHQYYHQPSLTSHPYTIPYTPTHEHHDQQAWQMQATLASSFEQFSITVEKPCQMQDPLGHEMQLHDREQQIDGATTSTSRQPSFDVHLHTSHTSSPQLLLQSQEIQLTSAKSMLEEDFHELCKEHAFCAKFTMEEEEDSVNVESYPENADPRNKEQLEETINDEEDHKEEAKKTKVQQEIRCILAEVLLKVKYMPECVFHEEHLEVDTSVGFLLALGLDTCQSLSTMNEEDLMERLMYEFDIKMFCRDCKRNISWEFNKLKEQKLMQKEKSARDLLYLSANFIIENLVGSFRSLKRSRFGSRGACKSVQASSLQPFSKNIVQCLVIKSETSWWMPIWKRLLLKSLIKERDVISLVEELGVIQYVFKENNKSVSSGWFKKDGDESGHKQLHEVYVFNFDASLGESIVWIRSSKGIEKTEIALSMVSRIFLNMDSITAYASGHPSFQKEYDKPGSKSSNKLIVAYKTMIGKPASSVRKLGAENFIYVVIIGNDNGHTSVHLNFDRQNVATNRATAVEMRENVFAQLQADLTYARKKFIGADIAKCILFGVNSVTLHGEQKLRQRGLSETSLRVDVGKKRHLAYVQKLREINNIVVLSFIIPDLTKEIISNFKVVNCADISLDDAPLTLFIEANVRGFLLKVIFVNLDFSLFLLVLESNHTFGFVVPSTSVIMFLSCALMMEGLSFMKWIFVVTLKARGMMKPHDRRPRMIDNCRLYLVALEENTTNYGTFERGAIVTQVKHAPVLDLKPLRETLIEPGIFILIEFSKVWYSLSHLEDKVSFKEGGSCNEPISGIKEREGKG